MRAEHVADAEHARAGGLRDSTASIVSAVSPDCDIAMASVSRIDRTGRRSETRWPTPSRRAAAQRAEQIHADHAGEVGGAAAGDRDLGHRAQQSPSSSSSSEERCTSLASSMRPAKVSFTTLRLDEDLLEHEVLEAGLFGGTRVPHHLRDLALDGPALEVGQLVASTVR